MQRRVLIPMDLEDFLRRFATEDACVQVLRDRESTPACARCRAPMQFRAPRRAWVCRCGVSRSVTEGTVFHRMKVPLRVAFHALGRMLLRPTSISALQLVREGLVRRYATAWSLLRRLRGAIEARLYLGLGFTDGRPLPSSSWTQLCGVHRRRVMPGWLQLDVDPARCIGRIDIARAPSDIDDAEPRMLAESFRAVVIGTHHGVSARYLVWYAIEHAARFIGMPVEALWL